MNPLQQRLDRFETLVGALRDGRLNPDESSELRELLKTLPGANRHLAEHMLMASLLEDELKVLSSETRWRVPQGIDRAGLIWRRFLWPALAGGLALALFLLYPKVPHETAKPASASRTILPGEQLDSGVAVLTESLGAICDQYGQPLVVGASIRPGSVRLKTGVVRIEFYSGASIILESAAELMVQSAREATLLSGKLLAKVPPHARGFTVHSPSVKVVDEGTEFGVTVTAQEGTRVHVFTGNVEVFDAPSSRLAVTGKTMLAGAGLQIHPNGVKSDFTADAGQFITPRALHSLISANLEERGGQWQNLSAQVRQDARVIAYYPFERDLENDRKLRNLSGGGEPLAGSIVGATWTSGRWPGKQALEFKRPGDRVRIKVPGRHPALTLVVWARIDGFDNLYNSLLLSDGWGRSGAMHWELLNSGQLELSVSARPTLDYDFRTSARNLRPHDLGRWVMLAAVYDTQQKSASHYVDGVLSERLPLIEAIPLQIGAAHIGNWSPSGYEDATPIRNFNGRMDELIIFGQALTSEEIAHFFQMGRPQF